MEFLKSIWNTVLKSLTLAVTLDLSKQMIKLCKSIYNDFFN